MKRKDGKRYPCKDMMYSIAPYFMAKRSDACNALTVRLPYLHMKEYISQKKAEGKTVSYMTMVIAAYVRALAKYPDINRFIVNKRIYSRNDIVVAMVVQRADGAQNTMTKLVLDRYDTIFDIGNKIEAFLEKNRAEDTNKTDAIMTKLSKLAFLLGPVTSILKFADKHGMLPKAILDASPFHAGLVISNLATIRTNHLYHHIYDFGTVSQIVTMGNLEDVPCMRDGKVELEKQLPLGVMCDERIASGYCYSKFFREMQTLLNHPEMLEVPPATVLTDFG